MEFIDQISKIVRNFPDFNWADPGFSFDKAYICSLFAKLAYLEIPEFELKNTDRINIIPCDEYRHIVSEGIRFNISDNFNNRNLDFRVEVVETPYVITTISKVQNIIFVSIRGTHYSYDWRVNLNCRRINPFADKNDEVYFHKGFYRAIASCMDEIFLKIKRISDNNSIIYVTGHSLGGALAAILHGLSHHHLYKYIQDFDFIPIELLTHANKIPMHSCYTFGMPRYGNLHSIIKLRNPFHIYNELDIVPTIPPRSFGFDDCFKEYCLGEKGKLIPNHRKKSNILEWGSILSSHESFPNHNMELYIKNVGAKADPNYVAEINAFGDIREKVF